VTSRPRPLGPRPLPNTCFLGPAPESKSQTASQSVQPFAQLTAQCPFTLKCPLKVVPSHEDRILIYTIIMFLGPTIVLTPQIKRHIESIGSAVFAGLIDYDTHTDRPIDHGVRSVIISRIYVSLCTIFPRIEAPGLYYVSFVSDRW